MTYASIEDASLDELGRVLAYLETRRDGERPPILLGAGPSTPWLARTTSRARTSTSSSTPTTAAASCIGSSKSANSRKPSRKLMDGAAPRSVF